MKQEEVEGESTVNKENVEESLTSLQTNMMEAGERIEYMMTAFQKFVDEFSANHMMLLEDVKGFKNEAKRLADKIYEKH